MSWRAILTAVFLTVVFLTGCGGPAGKDGQGATADGDSVTGDGETAMGRYVESSQTLDIGKVTDVVKLTDGRLELLEDGAEGRFFSADGGATWEADVLPFWHNLLMGSFVRDMKGAPDGSVAVLSKSYSMPIGDWNPGDAGTDSEDADEKFENVCELLLFSPGKEEKRFTLPDPEGYTLTSVCFSEDGERLFLGTRDEEIYEIDRETGEKRLLMQIDMIPDMFCVWEHYLAVKNEVDGVFLYDLDTGEQIEDQVLSDFVAQNYKRDDRILVSYTIFPAEDGGIYVAGAKGLHRHVIGGAVMEQVINGGLCGLSDPSNPVAVMKRSTNDSFLAAYAEGKVSSFTYDPDMSSTPSQTLSAYSLTESDILRQAITRYQEANPDVYVEYRVGLSEEGGATKEDVIKKLNTEIMAGKGPDLLILDGLPIDSYKEKGVLLDISPYLAKLETREPLLANIRESFTENGKITMIPAAVTLPMYYTVQENMEDVADLAALADLFEKLRRDHPGEQLMELHSKDMLFDAVFPVSAPNWITDAGEPDLERISGDLEQMKRIYDACMEGLPDRVLMRYEELEDMRIGDKVAAYNDLGGGAVQIAGDNVQVSMGALTNGYNYGLLQSVRLMAGKADNRLAQLPGSAADAFTPVALMGINAASQKSDLAGDFMQMILSKEMQSMIYPIGFPVNEEGLSLYMESLGGQVPESNRKPGEFYGAYGFGWDDGQMITVYLYVPKEEEAEELCDILKTVRTPYLQRAALEDAVRGAAEQYFDDIYSLEETMDGIREKSKIIMAE